MKIPALVTEPMVHFLILGGLLFGLFAAVARPGPAPADTIVVTPERIDALALGFERTWRRQPTTSELHALVDDFIREEIYYREALALGLDRDDTVIRRRLQQKMEFLTDTGADLLEPQPGDLEQYLAMHADEYRQPGRLTFEQIYLGEQPDAERIEAALRDLRSASPAAPLALGAPTLLPERMASAPPETIDGVFGDGFSAALAGCELGVWSGPLRSAYGVHLVHIDERQPERLPELAEIRDDVVRDWRTSKARELREQAYAGLREHYLVEIRAAQTPAPAE